MKTLFLILLILPCAVYAQQSLFFKADTTLIDSISFKDSPTGTFNNIIRIKRKPQIKLTAYTDGKGYDLKIETKLLLPLNMLYFVPKQKPEKTTIRNSHHGIDSIFERNAYEEAPFELRIVTGGAYFDDRNQRHTTGEIFTKDLNANSNFFYFEK